MGFFFGPSYKPKITQKEFKQVRSQLEMRGFSRIQRDRIEHIFIGDLDELKESERGIDAQELAMRIEWMRKNKDKHLFSDEKIDIIQSLLKAKLNN